MGHDEWNKSWKSLCVIMWIPLEATPNISAWLSDLHKVFKSACSQDWYGFLLNCKDSWKNRVLSGTSMNAVAGAQVNDEANTSLVTILWSQSCFRLLAVTFWSLWNKRHGSLSPLAYKTPSVALSRLTMQILGYSLCEGEAIHDSLNLLLFSTFIAGQYKMSQTVF